MALTDRDRQDLQRLEKLCEQDGLSEREQEAFPDMARRIRRGVSLSDPQHDWVARTFERLELDAEEPAKNLFSSGQVPRGREVRLPFEDMPRPLKPPSRRTD